MRPHHSGKYLLPGVCSFPPSSYRGYSNYTALPTGERLGFHINAVAHGRARCHVERPMCDGCPVLKHCVAPEAGRYSRRGDGAVAPPE